MKKTEYICNMCRGIHSKESADKGNIHAFYFNSAAQPQSYELRKYDAACDTHICKYCVNVILNSNGKIKD